MVTPIFFFWIARVLTKIYFICIISFKPRKNIRVSRDAQNVHVCAITIVGTILNHDFGSVVALVVFLSLVRFMELFF